MLVYRARYDADGMPHCGGCGAAVDLTADRFCPACAWVIAERIVDEPLHEQMQDHLGEPADNTGRPFKRQVQGYDEDEDEEEMAGSGRSQEERTRFLDEHPVRSFSRYLGGGDGGMDLNQQITEAEEVVARCEEAWAEASRDLRDASYHTRHARLAERSGSLTPAERSEYIESLNALAHWRRTEAEYEGARARLDALLARWDEQPSLADYEGSPGGIFRDRPPQLRSAEWPDG
jgi:hypothetical protein